MKITTFSMARQASTLYEFVTADDGRYIRVAEAALKVFDEIYVLTGATGGILDSGTTIVFYLWKEAFKLEHAGYAAAIAMVLLVLTLIFSIVNVRFLERGTEQA